MHLPCDTNEERVSQQINFIEEGQGTRNSNGISREDGRGLAGGMQMG